MLLRDTQDECLQIVLSSEEDGHGVEVSGITVVAVSCWKRGLTESADLCDYVVSGRTQHLLLGSAPMVLEAWPFGCGFERINATW